MGMFLIALAILLVIAGTVWLTYGKRPGSARPVTRSRATGPSARPGGIDKLENSDLFWGVELAQAGCEASHILLGKQFTFGNAPELPLDGCSSAMCTCQFKGLKNRRTQHRRKRKERRVEVRFDKDKPDRRSRKNRRRSDSWNDHTH